MRILGSGKQKSVIEVRLPSGEHAVAKRCKSKSCINGGFIKKEASMLKSLRDNYGTKVNRFYGECDTPYNHRLGAEQINNTLLDFSVGYTHVMEMGVPLLKGWGILHTEEDRKCFAKHFTDADRHDLRMIAHQYASNHEGCKIKMKPMTDKSVRTDNIYAEQYMIMKGGLRHGDFDNSHCCPDCSYEDLITFNCKTVSQVANQWLDCSSDEGPEKFLNKHINVTEAIRDCARK